MIVPPRASIRLASPGSLGSAGGRSGIDDDPILDLNHGIGNRLAPVPSTSCPPETQVSPRAVFMAPRLAVRGSEATAGTWLRR